MQDQLDIANQALGRLELVGRLAVPAMRATYAPRRRFFAYDAYLSILSEGTETPP